MLSTRTHFIFLCSQKLLLTKKAGAAVDSWVQTVISLGTFTIINLSATAFLIGKIVQTVKEHGEQIEDLREESCRLKDRMSPISSDDRLITVKECAAKQAAIVAGLAEIKSMLNSADQRHEDRMSRIESRRDELVALVFNLTGKFEGLKGGPRE
jgi:hypothetical protein